MVELHTKNREERMSTDISDTTFQNPGDEVFIDHCRKSAIHQSIRKSETQAKSLNSDHSKDVNSGTGIVMCCNHQWLLIDLNISIYTVKKMFVFFDKCKNNLNAHTTTATMADVAAFCGKSYNLLYNI